MSRILLVEDDLAMASAIARLLKREGHTVFQAREGEEGLARFATVRPDLVITDLIMPGREGIETIRELRALAPDLPILAVSGGGTAPGSDLLQMARKLGATEVLAKPFSYDELTAVVSRCLGSRRPRSDGPGIS